MKKKFDFKKFLLLNAPYIMIGYATDIISKMYRCSPVAGASEKVRFLIQNAGDLLSLFPSIHPIDIFVGFIAGYALKFFINQRAKNAKKFRNGTEYGSACWGTAADIEPFMDSVPSKNIPLTKTECLTMNSRPNNPKYARNKNILVIGGSGSGKTRFFVKPSLMQMHSSYVITDPKGSLIVETGKMLERHGYKIKTFNTINFKKSMKYNPFHYIRSEKDILKLVNVLIENTKGEGNQSQGDFWEKAERLLFMAYIGFIWYECKEEEHNFNYLIKMINASETSEEDENFKNGIDLLFERLEKRDPEHFAVKQYRKYKLAAGVATCN